MKKEKSNGKVRQVREGARAEQDRPACNGAKLKNKL